jgi:hypothetical protein
MPQLPKLPPKLDLLRHFKDHCALVKLLALVLVVARDPPPRLGSRRL